CAQPRSRRSAALAPRDCARGSTRASISSTPGGWPSAAAPSESPGFRSPARPRSSDNDGAARPRAGGSTTTRSKHEPRVQTRSSATMTTLAVVGAQWGDEGKGKVVDVLAAEADLVARFAGGNNAGHTL